MNVKSAVPTSAAVASAPAPAAATTAAPPHRLAVAVEAPLYSGIGSLLDYESGLPVAPGTLLRVPLGRREVPGIAWDPAPDAGAAAAGGMAVPALIYIAFNLGNTAALRGWAIPAATDIAFALGVLSLLGPKVPASLKIFLAALAIIDDLGAVIVIALFYTADLSLPALAGAMLVVGALTVMNRSGVMRLWPYLILGAVLWVLVLRSGIHATLAGVILALTVPIRLTPGTPEASPSVSPLHQLEHLLQKPVAFLIVPIFGFANAGVSFAGVTPAVLIEPLTLGVAAGLVVGKLVGVFGTVAILVKARLADLPAAASWGQTLGVALLCGIGFTMSLFIGLLAFDDPALQDRAKFGILFGSLIAGLAGYFILRISNRRRGGSPLAPSFGRKT